jgi:hypothetical protein
VDILQQAPSVQVDRINVGGNQSGQQSVYHGKGTTSDQNTWNVDGVNITDMGATGSSPLYFDFDSFEEMQITTGGSDPRVMTPGVQLNMVTKRGTNDIRGSSRYFYTPGSYQAAATVPAEASTYLDKTNRINYVRDYGAEVGGPVWKDHLWLWIADSVNKISNQASQAPGAKGAFDNIILRDKNAKINGQITSSNSAVGFYTWGDKVRNARNLGPTRPFEAAWHQSGPTKVYKAEDTQIFGSSLYLTGMYSKITGGFGLIPNGGISNTVVPYRDITNVWHGSYLFYTTQRPQKQYRLDGSKFFDLGTMNHELKFGFGYRSTPVASQSGWPGPAQGYERDRSNGYCAARGITLTAGQQCASFNLYRNRNAQIYEKYNDFYVGDTILMGNLTLQAGLRWDRQKTANVATASPGNPVIGTPVTVPINGSFGTVASLPGISYPGDKRALKWNSIEPRIGLTYALGADKKTLLRAGYNRYANQIGSTVFGASPLGAYSYFQFAGIDLNGDHVAQRNELMRIVNIYNIDPANTASLDSTTRFDYSMKTPHADELIVGLERELMSDFSVGVNYTYRKYSNLTETRAEHTQGKGDFFTRADYAVFTDAPPPVGSGLTYYDLKNPLDAPTFFVVRNRPDYSQKYNGLEFTATKRLSHNWMLRGNVSYSDWKESCGANSLADATRLIGNCAGGQVVERSAGSGAFGNVFINAKWSFNVTGLYQLPWDFNLGASLTGRQGYPAPYRYEIGTNTGGIDEVLIKPMGASRFSNVYELDLRAAKDFRFFNRVGVTISADLFNVPNKRTILQRETNLSAANGNRITEMQSPRVWRFGAKVNF